MQQLIFLVSMVYLALPYETDKGSFEKRGNKTEYMEQLNFSQLPVVWYVWLFVQNR